MGAHSQFWMYSLVYGMSAVALLFLQAIRGFFYNSVTLRASSKLHEGLYMNVSYSWSMVVSGCTVAVGCSMVGCGGCGMVVLWWLCRWLWWLLLYCGYGGCIVFDIVILLLHYFHNSCV